MRGRVLIAFASRGGATQKYAGLIAGRLGELGFPADLADLKGDPIRDLSPYGAVVVGAGVRIGRVYGKARKFLRRKDLAGKPTAVFLCSGMAVEDPERAREKYGVPFVEKCGVSPVLLGSFPGTYPATGGKFEDRTDREAALLWASELAGKLGGPGV